MTSSQPFSFADWPPTLTNAQRNELTRLATTYALAHGLLYLPPTADGLQPPAPTSAIHAPLALVPAPFPRKLVEEVQRLQRVYNVLYTRIALDTEFLDEVMGAETEAGAGRVDEFTGQLWRSWKRMRDEGVPEPVHLGIFRSDYLLHAPEASNADTPLALKQVEFNTISSSFGALSERTSGLHKFLLAATGYYRCSPYLKPENLPSNGAGSTVVEGIAAAHQAYGVEDARVLFVVQPNERNVFDQKWLEYELLDKHSVKVIRQTFDELLHSASLSSSRTLTVASPLHPSPLEVSVIYFRAGYTPTDYSTPAHYALREKLSRSRAISCPTLALQLAGGKKVQQALTKHGVLERFLLPSSPHAFGPEAFTAVDASAIRATWMAMWGLEDPASSADGLQDGVSRAYAAAERLVLKPQREGGGNNVYKEAIPAFLDALPARERAAWVAMALIEPPHGTGGYLVRAGSGAEGAGRAEVVSELGVFGWALFQGRNGKVEQGEGGYLVRTKGRESDEGGVAVGFSVLDSMVLVD